MQPLHEVFTAAIKANMASGRASLSAAGVATARQLVRDGGLALGSGPSTVQSVEVDIPTRAGKIGGLLYRPDMGDSEPPALIVYFHGGGWVAGSPQDFDAFARQLAHSTACTVLSVDYRLAPEHPFPAGLEDAEDALAWASENIGSLAANDAKIVVAGDSAGGNLAAVVSISSASKVEIVLQVLFYPVTDAAMTTHSYRQYDEGLPLTAADMKWFFSQYAPSSRWTEPSISPLRAALPQDVPPAWIALARYDVLHSEGLAYADRLHQIGKLAGVVTYEDLTHGFIRWFNLIDSASVAINDAAREIQKAIRR